MAAGHPPPSTTAGLSPFTPVPTDTEAWVRLLQRACQKETETGFQDVRGRAERYADFVLRCLREPPPDLSGAERHRLTEPLRRFGGYRDLAVPARRSLVIALRRTLESLRRTQRSPLPVAPPRLRLAEGADRDASGPGRCLAPETPLADLSGIGVKTAARLATMGLLVARDLVHHYPRDYLDYAHLVRIGDLEEGRTATIVATVQRSASYTSTRNRNLSVLDLQLRDVTGSVRVARFFAGRRFASTGWLKAQQRAFPVGATVAVSGLVKPGARGLTFADPLIEVLEGPAGTVRSPEIGRLVPVYPLTEGLTADRLRRCIATVLPSVGGWPDPIDAPVRERLDLPPRHEALQQMHRPSCRDSLARARRRLVLEELLLLQLGLGLRRLRLQRRDAMPLVLAERETDLLARFRALLPFPLTAAQERVLGEIRADLRRSRPMARLLQGDVGCGKTVVAVAAVLSAIGGGAQAALMVPTEVLAEQHFRRITDWMAQLHVSCALLTGSTPARRRRQLLTDLANGQLQLLVGTHALLEDPVRFARLGLVVVDEQHRFGVRQRDRLLAKGSHPHLLTMTATPIPRTLALTLHGDLDVSVIDTLPPGRRPVTTRVLKASQRERAWRLVRREVAEGRRAYVVLPLVEESETLEVRSAVEEHRRLCREEFPDIGVGLLHGRLSAEDKLTAIEAFASGRTQVLVSTTVVEVGVDVPQASVMVIDHAERFGLAQLHQLRGRVGRGADASHCLLIDSSGQAIARQRLEVLAGSSDGFEIAEMDLRLRGPGQVLGTRQSGLPDLALASLSEDGPLLEEARGEARRILNEDPLLERHPRLRGALAEGGSRPVAAARLN